MDGIHNRVQFYSEITATKVDWLWYPYIPFGKITILQGDPGDGKSTLMMDIISRVTTGRELPGAEAIEPIKVIYQCNEDGLSDTIRPRLERAHGNCNMVGFIEEETNSVHLDDEEIRNAITYMGAGLLVVDPFQAYLGEADMTNAVSIRRIFRRLGIWASTYRCAVVLIGHLNKKSGSKELYRGLGSIDLIALARSVLQIERDDADPEIRIIRHIKSSLAPHGEDKSFTISNNGEVVWLSEELEEKTHINPITESISKMTEKERCKMESAAEYLSERLQNGLIESKIIIEELEKTGFHKKTIKTTKKLLGIESIRKNQKWYWSLPNHGEDDGEEI